MSVDIKEVLNLLSKTSNRSVNKDTKKVLGMTFDHLVDLGVITNKDLKEIEDAADIILSIYDDLSEEGFDISYSENLDLLDQSGYDIAKEMFISSYARVYMDPSRVIDKSRIKGLLKSKKQTILKFIKDSDLFDDTGNTVLTLLSGVQTPFILDNIKPLIMNHIPRLLNNISVTIGVSRNDDILKTIVEDNLS